VFFKEKFGCAEILFVMSKKASNRNEYQEDFLGVKAAGAYGWQPYHLPVPLSWNLGTLIC